MPSTLGALAAFCSSVTWAIGSTNYAQIANRHSAYALNFTRALIALPLFLGVWVISAGGSAPQAFLAVQPGAALWLLVSMICSYAVGDIFFLYSTRSLGVPGALAIASSYPLWNALLAYAVDGEKMRALQVGGLVLALLGIVVVLLNGPDRGYSGRAYGPRATRMRTGIGFALGASICWALNSYAIAHAGRQCPLALANSIRMVMGLVLTFGMSRVFARGSRPWLPFGEMRGLLWVFVLEAFGGSYFFLYGLSHSSLAIGSVLTSLAPVISVPIAWVLRTEKASIFRSLGVGAVVLGLGFMVGA